MENEEVTESVTAPVKSQKTLFQKVRTFVLCTLLLSPMLYGGAHYLFANAINRAFHYEKQCTISSSGVGSSGSKSYSSSSYIYISSSDCETMEFVGRSKTLSKQEIANRIKSLKGRRVTVDVGVWQSPWSATDIVGIQGLNLND